MKPLSFAQLSVFRLTAFKLAVLVATTTLVGNVHALELDDERALRPFFETKFDQAGMSIHVPARPEWPFSTTNSQEVSVVELRTPTNYYPATVIQISRDTRYGSSTEDLADVAMAAMNTLRDASVAPQLDTIAQVQSIKTGEINGFVDQYAMTTENGSFDMKVLVGVFPSGHLVTVLVSTAEGQIDHIDHMVEKILRNVKEL